MQAGKLATVFGAALVAISVTGTTGAARADDPAFIAIGAGAYDWNRQKDEGTEVRIEYRHDEKIFGIFKPLLAAAVTDTDSYFVGAGVLVDVYLGNRLVLSPSFAPHYYNGGNNRLDLDHPLEFRSQLELAYRMDDRSRIGIAVSHYSNAGLGTTNPGTESAIVYYAYPLGN